MSIKDYSENKPAEIKKGRFIYFEKKKRKIKGLKNIIRDNAITYLETIGFKKFYVLYSCFIKNINWNVYFQF